MAKKRIVKKTLSTEKLLQETNQLLRINLIIELASYGVPHQTIRKIVGTEMRLITEILKPLKGKVDKSA